MNAVKSIFISHATPNDNQFSLWLALRLMSLGYEVWCDLLSLSKGGDFWSEIETQIRLNTFKFLLVQSKISNSREFVEKCCNLYCFLSLSSGSITIGSSEEFSISV